jgi:endonuclease YncB( thermonuclease family)
MRRQLRLLATLIALLLTFLFASHPFVNYKAVRVKYVIDGDTIILANNQKVRYIGVDTPETMRKIETGFVHDPKLFGEEAKEFNRRMVEGKVVRLEFDIVKKDNYGRLLAYCFAGDKFVNVELLRNGLAMLYTYVPNIKYVDILVKAQEEARESGINLWRPERVIPVSKVNSHLGELVIVEGEVLKAKKTNSAVYLNFGKDYRTDFSVVIFQDNFRLFNEQKINLENYYQGKTVRVSGLIKKYRGLQIIVRHPSQIEIVD